MLSFVEEITLLLLDDTQGRFVDLPLSASDVVVAGAALMDLALADRKGSLTRSRFAFRPSGVLIPWTLNCAVRIRAHGSASARHPRADVIPLESQVSR